MIIWVGVNWPSRSPKSMIRSQIQDGHPVPEMAILIPGSSLLQRLSHNRYEMPANAAFRDRLQTSLYALHRSGEIASLTLPHCQLEKCQGIQRKS